MNTHFLPDGHIRVDAGTPDYYIEMPIIPSWNDLLGMVGYVGAASSFIKKWRKIGYEQAMWHAERQGFSILRWEEHGANEKGRMTKIKHVRLEQPIFSAPVKVILRYWRPDNRRYDNFNPFVKPIVDGFTDAGIWPDDDNKIVREFTVSFEGVDTSLKLSKEGRAARALDRKFTNKKMYSPSRWRFEFYRL